MRYGDRDRDRNRETDRETEGERPYMYFNTLKRNYYLEHLAIHEVIIFYDNFIIYIIVMQGCGNDSENRCQSLSH